MWLCGPPGVGKTVVAWEVYRRLLATGVRAAYVDVDQLGICHPDPPDDPDRHRLKARNVVELRRNFEVAGAVCLVVSGVVDAERGPATDILGERALLFGRLRADADRLVARLDQRTGPSTVPAAVVHEAALLDRSTFADWSIDTTDISVDDVAQQVIELTRPLVGERVGAGDAARSPRSVEGHPAGSLLWLAGPTCVGKSTVGFRAYLEVLAAGVTAAFIDVNQLGFFDRSEDHQLQARNLASVWANHHAAGATALVVVGPLGSAADLARYGGAMPNAGVTVVRLHAGPAELTRRVRSRGGGGSWSQPGDPLKDLTWEELTEVADRAIAEAARLETSGVGLRVAVDGLSPDEAASEVLRLSGWPPGRP